MYQIGSTMSIDRKVKWLLDTIEHIDNRNADEVLKYDYYFSFRHKVNNLYHTVHKQGQDGYYVRKTVNELNFRDIKENSTKVVSEWEHNQRFLEAEYAGPLYAKVREVDKLVKLLKTLKECSFDDKKRWTFSYRDNAYHIQTSDPGDINSNQEDDSADNPEDDSYLFEDYLNPDPANNNPTRTKIRGAVNPEADPLTPKNPTSSIHAVHILLTHLHTLI